MIGISDGLEIPSSLCDEDLESRGQTKSSFRSAVLGRKSPIFLGGCKRISPFTNNTNKKMLDNQNYLDFLIRCEWNIIRVTFNVSFLLLNIVTNQGHKMGG